MLGTATFLIGARSQSTRTDMKVKSFWANIFVGLRRGYGGKAPDFDDVLPLCQGYVEEVGLAVTISPTVFVYRGGMEYGVIVGLINYARFPSTPKKILAHALKLARILRKELGQERVTVMTPTESILIGRG